MSARNQQGLAKVLEVVGGVVGGIHGSRLPDVLEPALTPYHRGPAHSLVAGVMGGAAAVRYTPAPVEALRAKARELAAAAEIDGDRWRAALLLVAALACHFGAGYLVGAATGYGSHLALDATTPRSLPLLFGGVG